MDKGPGQRVVSRSSLLILPCLLCLLCLLAGAVEGLDSTYQNYVITALDYLQSTWYNAPAGVYNSIGWWNAANCMTTVADLARLDPSGAASRSLDFDLEAVLLNTLARAPSANPDAPAYAGFLGDANDDEGWWALAMLHAYDATGNASFRDAAETIFADMATTPTSSPCGGGGIVWMKSNPYVNAISNELYLAVAAALANRMGDSGDGGVASSGKKQTYADVAVAQWQWFRSQDFLDSRGMISDGLTVLSNGSCVNNGYPVWSYNQGVILGALVELLQTGAAGPDSDLLPYAVRWATLAMTNLVNDDGILRELACEPNCDANQVVFKGVLVRNLRYLHEYGVDDNTAAAIRSFLVKNADSVWNKARFDNGTIGLIWSGPEAGETVPEASTHNSGLDCLMAAMAVA